MENTLNTADEELEWLFRADEVVMSMWVKQAAASRDGPRLATLVHYYLLNAGRKQAFTSTNTVAAYRQAVTYFLAWCGDEQVNLLQPAKRDLSLYVVYLKSRPNRGRGRTGGLASSTIAQYLVAANALYRALEWSGVMDGAVPALVHVPQNLTRSVVRNPPYVNELDHVLEGTPPHIQALLLLCAHAGLRITEALSVRSGDIRDHLLVVAGKGGKSRRVPLSARLRQVLKSLQVVEPGGRYFAWSYDQAYHRMKMAFQRAGVPWRGFHAARKSAATRLYRQTRDFTRVAIFLGHESADTTRRYVALDEDDLSLEVENW